MSDGLMSGIVRHIRRLAAAPGERPPPDRDLLEQFVTARDEAAFAALVARYGPLVWGVCRRVLGHEQDAEDAFQATFLVLAQRAVAVRKRGSVASWLYGVAHRVALHARAEAGRRRRQEKQGRRTPSADPVADLTVRELRQALDEELRRLPDRFRAPLLLCYLDGQTQDDAARQLGWSKGTLRRRLERGRELLRARLARRGVTLSSALCTAALAAAVPVAQAAAAVRAALASATGTASSRAATLAQGVLQGMAFTKVRAVLALAVVLGVLAAGAGLAAHQAPGGKAEMEAGDKAPPAAAGTDRPQPQGEKQVRSDLYGDPLPPGALVRMGTVRLRHSYAEVVFGADSKTLISVGGDGWDLNARYWEAATGKETRRIDLGARRGVRTIAADGKTVAVAEESRVLHVWEAATGKELRRIPVPPGRGSVNGIALSPDGRFIATASYTEAMFIQVWELATGSELWHLEQRNSWGGPLYYSPDGKTLLSAQGEALVLWDTSSGKELRRLPVKGANAAAFSPDGTLLASVVGDGTVALWAAGTGKELVTLREPAAGTLVGVAFSPDASLLAVAGVNGIVLREVSTREALRTLRAEFSGGVLPAFAPDGKTLTACGFGAIQLWDVATGKRLHSRPGHDGYPEVVAFSPDGRMVASASVPENGLRLWDAGTGQALHRLEAQDSYVNSVAFSADGKRVVSAGGDGAVRLWEADAGKELRKFVTESLGGGPERPRVRATRLSADGRRLAALSTVPAEFPRDNCQLDVWDTATGKLLTHRLFPGDWAPCFTPDGKGVTGWDRKGLFIIQDVSTGRDVATFAGDPNYPVALSPDGTYLVAASDADGVSPIPRAAAGKEPPRMTGVGFMDVATGKLLFRIETGPAALLALSPDGRVLATAGADVIRLWEVASGKEVFRIRWPGGFRGSPSDSFVKCLAFSPDGRTLATGHEDTTVVVWDIAPGLRQAAAVKELSPAELEELWADLAAEDAAKAYHAVWALVAVPARSVPFLKNQLRPARPPDAEHLRRMLADLDSEEFAAREAAAKGLAELGGDAAPALRKALEAAPSPEVRRRVEGLLAGALLAARHPVSSPEQLQALRAVHVLEQVGTTETRKVLEALAKGAPGARLTREAKASLERLAKRSTADQ